MVSTINCKIKLEHILPLHLFSSVFCFFRFLHFFSIFAGFFLCTKNGEKFRFCIHCDQTATKHAIAPNFKLLLRQSKQISLSSVSLWLQHILQMRYHHIQLYRFFSFYFHFILLFDIDQNVYDKRSKCDLTSWLIFMKENKAAAKKKHFYTRQTPDPIRNHSIVKNQIHEFKSGASYRSHLHFLALFTHLDLA